MKLIKMEYDRSDASVRQCLVDRQDLHRNIQRFFDTSREEASVLYRLTKDSIYVSASTEPIMSKCNGIYVAAIMELSAPKEGSVLRFNVFTRPYKKREGQRFPLTNGQERMDWLSRQGRKHGFEVMSANEAGHGIVKSRKKHFEIEGYYYSGILKVIDSEKFEVVLEKGIGAEKAYGFGMLMVV